MGSQAPPTALRDGLSPLRVSGRELSSRFGINLWGSLLVCLGAPSADIPYLRSWGSTPRPCLAAVVTLLTCTLPSSCHVKVGDAKIIMNPELVRERGFPDLSACSSPQNLFAQNYRTGQLLNCQVTSSWSSHSLPQQHWKDNLSFNHVLHKIYVFFPHRLVSDFSQYKLH